MDEDLDKFRALIREEIRQGFADIGLHPDDSDERREMRLDFMHLRRWREACDSAINKVGATVITVIVGGIFSLLWVGAKTHLFKQP